MNGNQSSSAMWKVIRNCIPSKKKSRPVYSRDMTELANEFNEFFTSVGQGLQLDLRGLLQLTFFQRISPPQPRPYSN